MLAAGCASFHEWVTSALLLLNFLLSPISLVRFEV